MDLFTVDDALRVGASLAFVVEPHPLHGETRLIAFLQRVGGTEPRAALRWSRPRGWETIGNSMTALGVQGRPLPERVVSLDVVETLLELRDYLELGRAAVAGELHPFDGALLWMRDLAPELDRPVVRAVLRELVPLLAERGATLLIDVEAAPAETDSLRLLGLVVADPRAAGE